MKQKECDKIGEALMEDLEFSMEQIRMIQKMDKEESTEKRPSAYTYEILRWERQNRNEILDRLVQWGSRD